MVLIYYPSNIFNLMSDCRKLVKSVHMLSVLLPMNSIFVLLINQGHSTLELEQYIMSMCIVIRAIKYILCMQKAPLITVCQSNV